MARAFAVLKEVPQFSSDGTVYLTYNVTYVDPVQIIQTEQEVPVVTFATDSAIAMQIKLSAAIKQRGAELGLVVTNQEITQPAYLKGNTVYTPVRAATNSNINLSAPGSVFDGVTFQDGDANLRLLVKAQTSASQNGIYVWVAADQPLVRASDADDDTEIVNGAGVIVQEGIVNGPSQWLISSLSPAPWVDGSSGTSWSRFVFPSLS